jgi:hypothetical protein
MIKDDVTPPVATGGDVAVTEAARAMLGRPMRVRLVDGRVYVGEFNCLDK